MIETVDRLKRLLKEKNAELDIAHGTIRMAVDRLGGTVEGKPTHEGNFLQRIDELRRIEDRESGWSKDYDSLARKLDVAEKQAALMPELLEACKLALRDLEDELVWGPVRDALVAAIAKATEAQ